MRDAHERSRLALALLATTMLTGPGPVRAAPGDSLGTEIQVNTVATDNQRFPTLAMDADGDFAVAWASYGQDGSSYGVFAQRFDAAGSALGPPFQVNTYTTGLQQSPAVAMDANGDFLVAWQSDGQDGSSNGIFAQLYDDAGVAKGPEIAVNSFTALNQFQPAVAMDADGDFVVAWQSTHEELISHSIFARRFDAAGVAQGIEFRVDTSSVGEQRHPAVAMDADGDFVIAWHSYPGDGSSGGVFAQRYDAAGSTQGGEFQINTYTTSNQQAPAIASDAGGDFVVAWESRDQDFGLYGVFAQRYDATGTPQGPEFQVNTFFTNDQIKPVVTMDSDGDFAVAWTSFGQDGYSFGIFAQRYDAAGVAQGPEVQVNTFAMDIQSEPAVAMDADGDVVVAWESYGQDGDGFGVFAQRYDGVERTEADFDGDGNADLLWHNTSTGNAVLWLMDGTGKLASVPVGAPPLVWQVAGSGDFDGDGKADILWRNTANGSAVIWQMDGFTRLAVVPIGGPPLAWAVEQMRDTDGDGISDIVWRHGTTGKTVVWRMSALKRVATGSPGGPGTDWQLR